MNPHDKFANFFMQSAVSELLHTQYMYPRTCRFINLKHSCNVTICQSVIIILVTGSGKTGLITYDSIIELHQEHKATSINYQTL